MSIVFCNHTKDFNAKLVQLLVQNYIENEHKENEYYTYSEIINDIDVFSTKLETIPEIQLKLKSKKPSTHPPIYINLFFDIIPSDSYKYAIEVKHASFSILLRFGNLMQLIDKVKYPESTKLELILVPLDNEESTYGCETYDDYKQRILELSDDKQYKVFNNFKNNTGRYGYVITDMLLWCLIKINELPDYGENNITQDEFIKLKTNFSKSSIRIISLNELLKIPIHNELIERIIKLNK